MENLRIKMLISFLSLATAAIPESLVTLGLKTLTRALFSNMSAGHEDALLNRFPSINDAISHFMETDQYGGLHESLVPEIFSISRAVFPVEIATVWTDFATSPCGIELLPERFRQFYSDIFTPVRVPETFNGDWSLLNPTVGSIYGDSFGVVVDLERHCAIRYDNSRYSFYPGIFVQNTRRGVLMGFTDLPETVLHVQASSGSYHLVDVVIDGDYYFQLQMWPSRMGESVQLLTDDVRDIQGPQMEDIILQVSQDGSVITQHTDAELPERNQPHAINLMKRLFTKAVFMNHKLARRKLHLFMRNHDFYLLNDEEVLDCVSFLLETDNAEALVYATSLLTRLKYTIVEEFLAARLMDGVIDYDQVKHLARGDMVIISRMLSHIVTAERSDLIDLVFDRESNIVRGIQYFYHFSEENLRFLFETNMRVFFHSDGSMNHNCFDRFFRTAMVNADFLKLIMLYPELRPVVVALGFEANLGSEIVQTLQNNRFPSFSELGVSWFPNRKTLAESLVRGLVLFNNTHIIRSIRKLLGHVNSTSILEDLAFVLLQVGINSEFHIARTAIDLALPFIDRIKQQTKNDILKYMVRTGMRSGNFSQITNFLINEGADINIEEGRLLLAVLIFGYEHSAAMLRSLGAELTGDTWKHYASNTKVLKHIETWQPHLLDGNDVSSIIGEVEQFSPAFVGEILF